MDRRFAVTWDYRCPFARNAHEAVVAGLAAGRGWDVHFVPFSLDQVHLDRGEAPAWDRPPHQRGAGVLALQWGLAVRDHLPEGFLAFHLEVFAARHRRGERIDHSAVLERAAARVGLDPGEIGEIVEGGAPLAALAKEHTEAVERWSVFGVPTFIEGEEAAFVRLMERGRVEDIDEVLRLLPAAGLNEFKRTRLPR